MLDKIPVVGKLLRKLKKRFTKDAPFITSEKYWEDRYKRGGNSGAGSYNNLAEFKAEIINKFVKENQVSSVIELGCGDGNQLKYFNFKSYIGFDVSSAALSLCRNLYKNDPSKQFKLVKDYANEKADLVLSLDVIYHLIEEEVYARYMNTLFNASNNYVIIYSSNEDNHENNDIAPHVKHRKFTNWVSQNAPQFELVKHIPNRYTFDGVNERSSYADFYIFQK